MVSSVTGIQGAAAVALPVEGQQSPRRVFAAREHGSNVKAGQSVNDKLGSRSAVGQCCVSLGTCNLSSRRPIGHVTTAEPQSEEWARCQEELVRSSSFVRTTYPTHIQHASRKGNRKGVTETRKVGRRWKLLRGSSDISYRCQSVRSP